jgi:hypothetical protein
MFAKTDKRLAFVCDKNEDLIEDDFDMNDNNFEVIIIL